MPPKFTRATAEWLPRCCPPFCLHLAALGCQHGAAFASPRSLQATSTVWAVMARLGLVLSFLLRCCCSLDCRTYPSLVHGLAPLPAGQ